MVCYLSKVNHEQIKDNTQKILLDYYNKVKDVNAVIVVARAMLKSKNSNPMLRGELAETILSLMIRDYVIKNNLEDWILSKGLILKDLDNPDSNYSTELDVTVFTPNKVLLFECKSYKGEKIIKDPGELWIKNRKTGREKLAINVYDQHMKHYKVLYKYIRKFKIGLQKTKPFSIAFFNFSDGECRDERSRDYKNLFPVVDETNLYKYLDAVVGKEKYWDMKYIRKVVKILNETKRSLSSAHIKYVSNLNNSRNKG